MSTFKKTFQFLCQLFGNQMLLFFHVNFQLNWELYVVWIIDKCVTKNFFHSNIQGEICRTQLFLPAEDYSGDPPTPPEAWREKCSSLLKKSVRL